MLHGLQGISVVTLDILFLVSGVLALSYVERKRLTLEKISKNSFK